MISFFWIVTFLFVILLVAQWTVLLCVRKYMLALPKFHFGIRNLAILGLSVIVNLVIAYLSIMPFWADNYSELKQFISVSYFFFLGICLALFVFFIALGGIDLLFGAFRSALNFIMRQKRSTYQAGVDDDKKLNRSIEENAFSGATDERADSKMTRRTFMRYAATTGTGAIVTLGSYGLAEAYDSPKLESFEVTDQSLIGLSRQIRLIQVTDIHYGMFYGSFSLGALVGNLNSIEADALVITGDLFHSPNTPVESAVPILRRLRKRRWGNFAVLGNHDFYAGIERSVQAITQGGISLLRNEWITFHEDGANIRIGGIDDPRANWLTGKQFPEFFEFIRKEPQEPGFRILLSHRPVVFPLAVQQNIHLTLSGHTHGGQITLPAPGELRPWSLAGLVSPYTLGMYKEGNSRMYVNRGVGLTFVPARINCPPEIAIINLVPPGLSTREV